MNTTSIIALSAFVVIFVILLLFSSIAIIYLIYRLHHTISAFHSTLTDHLSGLDDSLISHRQALLDLTTNHHSQLALLSQTISHTLESHKTSFDAQINRINGEAIQASVKELTSLVVELRTQLREIKACAIAFGELARHYLSEEYATESGIRRAQQSGLGPEDYAPESPDGQPYSSRSRTALGDDRAFAEEARDNQTDTP